MARGLEPGTSPEILNIENPEMIVEVAALYVDSGADLITTNTFGGSSIKLRDSSLDERTEEINAAAVEVIKPAVRGRAYVSASVGPTGKMLVPYGEIRPEEASEAFHRQIGAMIDAGADVVCIETMFDLAEARLAIQAARSHSSDLPIIATMTFDKTPRGYFTIMGNSIEQACGELTEAGADIVGSNCGNGIEKMVEIAEDFVRSSSVPVVIQSNAGIPETHGLDLVYPESPEFMAERVGRLVDLGVGIIGGCCGTGPEHIRAFRAVIDRHSA
jgi:5-methyltetrahydrofolate--homocysteine methyltransferase